MSKQIIIEGEEQFIGSEINHCWLNAGSDIRYIEGLNENHRYIIDIVDGYIVIEDLTAATRRYQKAIQKAIADYAKFNF